MRGGLQRIQALVPLCHLSFNSNVCGLGRCHSVRHSNKKCPLDEKKFLETWDIMSSMD